MQNEIEIENRFEDKIKPQFTDTRSFSLNSTSV